MQDLPISVASLFPPGADFQLHLCRRPHCHVSALTAPSTASELLPYALACMLPDLPEALYLATAPGLSRRPPQSLGGGPVGTPPLRVSVSKHLLSLLIPTGLWPLRPHVCPMGPTHPATSPLGRESPHLQAGFLIRAVWGAPEVLKLEGEGRLYRGAVGQDELAVHAGPQRHRGAKVEAELLQVVRPQLCAENAAPCPGAPSYTPPLALPSEPAWVGAREPPTR